MSEENYLKVRVPQLLAYAEENRKVFLAIHNNKPKKEALVNELKRMNKTELIIARRHFLDGKNDCKGYEKTMKNLVAFTKCRLIYYNEMKKTAVDWLPRLNISISKSEAHLKENCVLNRAALEFIVHLRTLKTYLEHPEVMCHQMGVERVNWVRESIIYIRNKKRQREMYLRKKSKKQKI